MDVKIVHFLAWFQSLSAEEQREFDVLSQFDELQKKYQALQEQMESFHHLHAEYDHLETRYLAVIRERDQLRTKVVELMDRGSSLLLEGRSLRKILSNLLSKFLSNGRPPFPEHRCAACGAMDGVEDHETDCAYLAAIRHVSKTTSWCTTCKQMHHVISVGDAGEYLFLCPTVFPHQPKGPR